MKNMKYIKSAGFVVFKRYDNYNHYLIIKSRNGDLGFPKGHMERDESEIETAIRELKEETGVTAKEVFGFKAYTEYPLPKNKNEMKSVIYFLGEYESGEVISQESEVLFARFMPYDEALSLLSFDATKDVLKQAETYLRSML